MSDHGQHLGGVEWDERYGDEKIWSGQPNEQLVVEASDLDTGTVLDVGCGEGADAIWLAERGWRVTAIDVSAKALDRAARAAAAVEVVVDWQLRGLEGTDPATYDLVSVFYPALLRGDGTIIKTLLGCVAAGGLLLVVHHADFDREHALEHGFDPDDYVGHDDLVRALAGREGWLVETAGERPRTAPDGPGSNHHTDSVLRVRRAG